MDDSTVLKLAAIAGIVILDGLAIIVLNTNHTLLLGSIATIAGIAGYGIGSVVAVRKCNEKIRELQKKNSEHMYE